VFSRLRIAKPIHIYVGLIILLYGFALGKHVVRHEGNITSLFFVGSHLDRPPAAETGQLYEYEDSDGYDGQFYLLIAMDPFSSRGFADFIDSPLYRYTRILLPLSSYVLAAGQLALVPYTYVLVNLFGLALGCYFFLKIIRFYGMGDFYILLYPISAGMFLAIKRMLPDALAMNLVIAAIYYHISGRERKCLIFLILAALAKETMVVVSAAFFLSSIIRKKKISASSLSYLIPAALLLLWMLALFPKFQAMPGQGAGNLTIPFMGILKRVWVLMRFQPAASIELINVLTFAILASYSLVSSVQRTDATQFSFAALGLLTLSLDHQLVWTDIHSYGRIVQPLVYFAMIVSFREGRSFLRLPAFLMFAETIHLLAAGKFLIYR
jgi:hypothetical protein